MIFTVEAKDFRAALQIAGRVIPSKSPWPILTNLKIVTNDDRVTLTGSNGDMTFEADVPAEIETEGAAILSHDVLTKFCTASKKGALKVAQDGNVIKVSAGRSRIALSAGPIDDFPIYRPADGEAVDLDADTLARALRFCVAAASTEEAKYYLQGAYITSGNAGVDVFGTDGYGLHIAAMPDAPSVGAGAILPRDAVEFVTSACEDRDTVSLMVGEKGWLCAAGGLRAWGKVVDGSFPDVRRVIEGFGNGDVFAVAPVDDLDGAIRIATVGADEVRKRGRGLVFIAEEGDPIIIRGGKAVSGVTAPGRAEMETAAKASARFCVSSDLLARVLPSFKGDIEIASLKGGDGVRVRPAQEDAHLALSATIMGIRATEAELQDV
ncbi:DNA polymerase III subunit beta [Mameliella alba]|uniref:DNA polymerase III subunit beta n=1 Tax=Mameliella alba TaxID=561184 RepID=UPI000B52D7EA|nr:DNA polymerase III subunit beta [Mameliella alba]OWV44222.1 hypothetical protein CDZ95_05930 [Mameliella alba]